MDEYHWPNSDVTFSHRYLLPAISKWIQRDHEAILDIGCGNGALTQQLAQNAASHVDRIVGIGNSLSGAAQASGLRSRISFEHHLIDEALPSHLTAGFDLIIAAEVIEHLFFPRSLLERATEALRPRGSLIITTPEHNYWKNLALALTNNFDQHWNPLADYGHIKFFSEATLTSLAAENGFHPVAWQHAGRIPPFAKSLCALFQKP